MALRKAGPAPAPTNNPVFERELLRLTNDQIKPHPRNVNVGDVDTIGESVDELGLFDPMIWNRRNGMLVAGTHTWLTLRKRGWTEFDVVVVDVDEETHIRMMLAHNQVATKSRREERGLAELMRELEAAGATRGTGYSRSEIEDLLKRTDADLAKARATASNLEVSAAKALEDVDLPDLDPATDVEDNDFAKVSPDLGGTWALKPNAIFSGTGDWDIPELDPSMIPTYDQLPHDIMPWAGSATRDWHDPDQWWLYNIKVDSTSGMADLSKMIPAFYVHDEYIEVWWSKAAEMTSRMLASGVQFVVSPDFSPHTPGVEARIGSLWNLFRNRWMARYFQEAGLMVIPNINWAGGDEAFLVEHTLPTLPPNPPMIAMQLQALFSQSRDKAAVARETEDLARQVQTIFDTVKPGGALIYHGKVGREFFEANVQTDVPIIWVQGRNQLLGEKGKRNMRKKTL